MHNIFVKLPTDDTSDALERSSPLLLVAFEVVDGAQIIRIWRKRFTRFVPAKYLTFRAGPLTARDADVAGLEAADALYSTLVSEVGIQTDLGVLQEP